MSEQSEMTYAEVFERLDSAARANLSSKGLRDYQSYKARLVADGDSPRECDEILTGWIWGVIEEESA